MNGRTNWSDKWWQWCGACCALGAVWIAASPVAAQALDIGEYRREFDSEFADRLEALAARCDELGMTDQAALTRAWMIERRPDRMYVFVPQPTDPLQPTDDDPDVQFWYQHFREHRRGQAERLFGLAEELAEAGRSAESFRLLHEVLREDPDHQPTRRALGYRQNQQGEWLRSAVQVHSRPATRAQADFGWPARSYTWVRGPNLNIDCAADAEIGEILAERAEAWHCVWRQVFFDFWSRGHDVQNWLAGRSADSGSRQRFDLVLFRDREQYLSDLRNVPGIEISRGYYHDQQRKSYFYADERESDTWRHELTHQWFQETIPTRDSPSEQAYAWAVEGIAMFMESMRELEGAAGQGVVTLGGFDSLRVQYARLRFHRDQFFLPLPAMNALGRQDLQRHPDVQMVYSQAAGLSHFLMESEHRESFIEFLKALYSPGGQQVDFADYVGEGVDIDRAYQQWLLPVDSAVVSRLRPEGQTALAVPRSGIDAAAIERIARLEDLQWLELSRNPLDDRAIEPLSNLSQLTQLFIDSTGIGDQGVASLTALEQLEQLDLSATRISDRGMEHVARLGELRGLWLVKTEVSDTGLQLLSQLPHLEFLDVRETRVTAQGIARLKETLPELLVVN